MTSKKYYWKEEETQYLLKNYSNLGNEDLSFILRRSKVSIGHKAKFLKLKKSPELLHLQKSQAGKEGSSKSLANRIAKYGNPCGHLTMEQRKSGEINAGKKRKELVEKHPEKGLEYIKKLWEFYKKNPERATEDAIKRGKAGGKKGGAITREKMLGKTFGEIFGKEKATMLREKISLGHTAK